MSPLDSIVDKIADNIRSQIKKNEEKFERDYAAIREESIKKRKVIETEIEMNEARIALLQAKIEQSREQYD